MARSVLLTLGFAVVLGLPAVGWPEDPPPAPPVLPGQPAPAGGPEAGALDPAQLLGAAEAPIDLRAFVLTLHGQLEELREPPRKTPTDHALFDAWTSILEPRVGRMAARLKRIAEEPRWMLSADGTRRILKPESWDVVVREAASLYAELGGALEQYQRFRVSFTPASGFGLRGPEPGVPDPTAQERALWRLTSLESALEHKLATGQIIWTDELTWYWNLARRAELEVQRYQRDLERWQREVAAFEDLQARIAYGLSFQRQTLSLLMFGLRALVAALQAAEEDRLHAPVTALAAEHPRRAEADALLTELRSARNTAEAHGGAQPAGWGTLLRQRWMGPRLRLLALLRA